MKITFWSAIFLAGLFLINTSCKQNASSTEVETAAADPAFVPNPVAVPKQEVKVLETGQSAPDFRLPDVNGKFVSLSDFNKSDVLVIIFHCNHCPTAQAYEDRMISFTNDYKDKSVAMVAIMPNSALVGEANLLVFPNIDSANIAYNLLKTAAGGNIAIGPVLLGANKPVHILTASTTVRRIVNMTALTVADANATRVA